MAEQDIRFRGTNAPLRIDGAEGLLQLLPRIISGWPYEVCKPDTDAVPFFVLRSEDGSDRFLGGSLLEQKPERRYNPVNALCDVAATLPYAMAATDERLICLHAASVEFSGQLVVFPNIKRAGKSTLSAALAMAGNRVFSDDVTPTSFDGTGNAYGHAMGVAPRLRMPFPATVPEAFLDWVSTNPGPDNGQYKYLTLDTQPRNGESAQIGAFVILDRQDEPIEANLTPVGGDAAMDVLLYQNFTRDRHSADVLKAIAGVLAHTAIYRLTFSDLTDAVATLQTTFANGPVEVGRTDNHVAFRLADLTHPVAAEVSGEETVRRRDKTYEHVLGETLYLSDAKGRAIHRMDALATAIWEMMETPIETAEIKTALGEAFPDVPAQRIADDLDALIGRLAKAGLIEGH